MRRFFIFFAALLLAPAVFAQSADSLNILLFGHSFGVDCTEYLPRLLDAADIRTVRIARFKKSNCSLKERYQFFVTDNPDGYMECAPGTTEWKGRPCTFKEAAAARTWDYVVFQNSLENEGRYAMAQPYLNDLVAYVRAAQKERFGKEPVICWNMFWPMSRLLENTENKGLARRMEPYGHDSQKMWEAYMAATKELTADTGIDHIIPSGTAVMNARASYLNTSEAREFTKDGYHMSSGAGRYLAACSWFAYFITPRYGVSVLGNPLRMPDAPSPVTDENAPFLQRCAVEAVAHPFMVQQWPEELSAKPYTLTRLVREVRPFSVQQLTVEAGASAPFRVLHISDAHITKVDKRDTALFAFCGKRIKPWSDYYLEKAMQYAQSRGLRLLHTGDMMDFASEANLDHSAALFRMQPFLFCPGNHEFSHTPGAAEKEAYKAEIYDKLQSACPQPLDHYATVVNGVNFVLLDDSYYRFSQEQFRFLKAEFAKGLPVILLCHVPFYTPELCAYALKQSKGKVASVIDAPAEVTDAYNEQRRSQQAADKTTLSVLAWLKKQPQLKAVLCGHLHYNFQSRFSPSAMQYTVGALFNGDAYEIEIK